MSAKWMRTVGGLDRPIARLHAASPGWQGMVRRHSRSSTGPGRAAGPDFTVTPPPLPKKNGYPPDQILPLWNPPPPPPGPTPTPPAPDLGVSASRRPHSVRSKWPPRSYPPTPIQLLALPPEFTQNKQRRTHTHTHTHTHKHTHAHTHTHNSQSKSEICACAEAKCDVPAPQVMMPAGGAVPTMGPSSRWCHEAPHLPPSPPT